MKWYALFVKTGNEDKVKLRLEYRFKGEPEVFIPKYILRELKGGVWRERERVLFPGYVLLRGDMTPQILMQMWYVPDLLKILKMDCLPVSIPNEEVADLFEWLDEDDTIGISEAIMVGDKVSFIQGPLALISAKGEIISIDKRKGRARVRFHFLGQERVQSFSFNLLGKAPEMQETSPEADAHEVLP